MTYHVTLGGSDSPASGAGIKACPGCEQDASNPDDGDDANADMDSEADQVMRVLWESHEVLFCCFDYYACFGSDIVSLSFNSWSQFVADCGLVSNQSKYCKKADIDRLV